MTTYAIGDIQGCYDELRNLLKEISFNPKKDKLWFVGDLVNRGPDSLETLRFIKSLKKRAVCVLGNHDLHLLAASQNKLKYLNPKDTLKEILKAPDKKELLDWLRHRPLMHHSPKRKISMVHAGIHPRWTIKQALGYAAEVEKVLRSNKYPAFLNEMYGNYPTRWNEKLKGMDRLRFITNSFTRLRYCYPNGEQRLKDKGPPGNQIKGAVPWFEVPGRTTANDDIIFGHWSTLEQYKKVDKKYKVYPLDTGCLWGGEMTALKLKNRKQYRVYCNESARINTFL